MNETRLTSSAGDSREQCVSLPSSAVCCHARGYRMRWTWLKVRCLRKTGVLKFSFGGIAPKLDQILHLLLVDILKRLEEFFWTFPFCFETLVFWLAMSHDHALKTAKSWVPRVHEVIFERLPQPRSAPRIVESSRILQRYVSRLACDGTDGVSSYWEEWRTTCSCRSGNAPRGPSWCSSWRPLFAKPPWRCRWWRHPSGPRAQECSEWAWCGCSWRPWWKAWPLSAWSGGPWTCGGWLAEGNAQCRQQGREGRGGTWCPGRRAGWWRPKGNCVSRLFGDTCAGRFAVRRSEMCWLCVSSLNPKTNPSSFCVYAALVHCPCVFFHLVDRSAGEFDGRTFLPAYLPRLMMATRPTLRTKATLSAVVLRNWQSPYRDQDCGNMRWTYTSWLLGWDG